MVVNIRTLSVWPHHFLLHRQSIVSFVVIYLFHTELNLTQPYCLECGEVYAGSFRIVGGDDTQFGGHPWMVGYKLVNLATGSLLI